MGQICRVSCEELIASIAAQGYSHRRPRESREQVCRDERAIAQRLIQQPGNLRDYGEHLLFGEAMLVMLGSKMGSHLARRMTTRQTMVLEGNRECLYTAEAPRMQGSDRAGIDSARQKNAKRDVGNEPLRTASPSRSRTSFTASSSEILIGPPSCQSASIARFESDSFRRSTYALAAVC